MTLPSVSHISSRIVVICFRPPWALIFVHCEIGSRTPHICRELKEQLRYEPPTLPVCLLDLAAPSPIQSVVPLHVLHRHVVGVPCVRTGSCVSHPRAGAGIVSFGAGDSTIRLSDLRVSTVVQNLSYALTEKLLFHPSFALAAL